MPANALTRSTTCFVVAAAVLLLFVCCCCCCFLGGGGSLEYKSLACFLVYVQHGVVHYSRVLYLISESVNRHVLFSFLVIAIVTSKEMFNIASEIRRGNEKPFWMLCEQAKHSLRNQTEICPSSPVTSVYVTLHGGVHSCAFCKERVPQIRRRPVKKKRKSGAAGSVPNKSLWCTYMYVRASRCTTARLRRKSLFSLGVQGDSCPRWLMPFKEQTRCLFLSKLA